MKKTLVFLAVLASAGAAFAQVNPTHPMVTGRGNVNLAPASVIITNQTNPTQDAIKLDRFIVTGSVLVNPAQPMVTGRGNVAGSPMKLMVTNQTDPTHDTIKLDRFIVTGSLLPH